MKYREVYADDNAYPFNISDGLTKREYFAAMAMQGLIASGLGDEYDPYKVNGVAVDYANSLIDRLNE